jgi:aspartyl-tRNA(Asn)/glutamyl-tRNA(Gln) amidotransferase subunit C
MKIDEKTVREVAALARLNFTDQEITEFSGQFEKIVNFVEQLKEVDTSSIDELHVHQCEGNVLSADEIAPGFSREETLANAPQTDGEYFLVPKVIKGSKK